MALFNNFINGLIPERFRLTYEEKSRVRGVLITQIILGVILFFIGIFYWVNGHILHELVLNTGIGIILLISIFSLHLFGKFESYINSLLALGYIDLAAFTIKAGGVFADAPFWFALLIAISIFYTTNKQAIFWITIVVLFISSLFYLQINGHIYMQHTQVNYTKKATTLISYYTLLIAIAYSFARINKKKSNHHLEIIEKHKRLLKERDDLMSVIAHDLKSPSSRVEGLISIFDQNNLSKDQKEILDRLKTTAEEGKQLIDDLLEAKSVSSNLIIEKVSINQLVLDLKTGFLPLSNKKNILIITRGLRSKLIVETSSFELKRILDNLLSNAIKFSPLNTSIEIICVQNSTNTSISIKDQGPGFTPDDEEKMFKKFQKLTARPTAGESSSGLGLSIVKQLTEEIKGQVKYVTQLNKGTNFTIVLPNKYPIEENSKNS